MENLFNYQFDGDDDDIIDDDDLEETKESEEEEEEEDMDTVKRNRLNKSSNDVTFSGYSSCGVSGCYCRGFEGLGNTCYNCGHGYNRHY